MSGDARIDTSVREVRRRTAAWADDLDDEGLAELDARMLWSALCEPGDGIARALVTAFGASRALEIAQGSEHDVSQAGVAPPDLRDARSRWLPRLGDAVHASDSAERAGVRPIVPTGPHWPARVDALGAHAPICLWVKGDPRTLSVPAAVALVGARAATTYGEHIASSLSADLAAAGIGVVSGGAYGIDGAAHRAALAAGGATIAWMAGGVDRPYPAGHRSLLERIAASGGAVVADVPCGSAPTKWRFLARNRLIAASADATIVVEAGWRSGSLNTAGHAATLGRALGAVPGPVTSPASAGCHRLLREYDAVCVTSVADARELIGLDSRAPLFEDVASAGDAADRTRVLDALSSRTARSAGDLARRTGMALPDVEGALGMLALDGRAERSGAGWKARPR